MTWDGVFWRHGRNINCGKGCCCSEVMQYLFDSYLELLFESSYVWQVFPATDRDVSWLFNCDTCSWQCWKHGNWLHQPVQDQCLCKLSYVTIAVENKLLLALRKNFSGKRTNREDDSIINQHLWILNVQLATGGGELLSEALSTDPS